MYLLQHQQNSLKNMPLANTTKWRWRQPASNIFYKVLTSCILMKILFWNELKLYQKNRNHNKYKVNWPPFLFNFLFISTSNSVRNVVWFSDCQTYSLKYVQVQKMFNKWKVPYKNLMFTCFASRNRISWPYVKNHSINRIQCLVCL